MKDEAEFEKAFEGVKPRELLGMLKENMVRGDEPSLREQTQAKAVETLFDDSKLKMISRLKGSYASSGAVLKMLIVSSFYVKAWAGIRMRFKAIKIKDPPFYRLVESVQVDDPMARRNWMNTCYDDLILDVLRLSISGGGGLGRGEMVEIVKSLNQLMRENELKQMRMMEMQGGPVQR